MTNFNEDGQLTLSRHVELKPYRARPFKSYQLMTDQEIASGAGGTLIVDTETYTNYHLIAFKDYATKKIIKFEINPFTGELINPRKLAWIMQSYRTIGFNTIKYDLPIIWLAHTGADIKTIKQASDFIIFMNERPRDIAKRYGFVIFPSTHVDLIEVCPLRGSLKLYAGRLHATRIQDLPFDVNQDITEEQTEIVADYCINDLDSTELLLDNLKEQLQLRENLSIEYRQDVMSKSDAQIAEQVISIELKRLTGEWPKKPQINYQERYRYIVPNYMQSNNAQLKRAIEIVGNTEFTIDSTGRLSKPEPLKELTVRIANSLYRMGLGGLHSSETCVVHKEDDYFELYDRDVASYYPAVILNQKLYPQHLGTGFLEIYQSLVNRRLDAKKAKRIAESENLKVTINGTFGKTGSPYSVIYSPQMTIQITLTGQLALLMLVEWLENVDINIISANTDGIVIKCPKHKKEKMLEIVATWEKATGFITEETTYKAVYSRDVNAYMAIKHNNEVKGKNVFYDPWRGKTAKDAYWRFQKNPQAQICVKAIEQLILECRPIADTIAFSQDITEFVTVKNVAGGAHKDGEYLGKVIRWYYAKNQLGTINYIDNGHKVPDSEGGRPCMDLPETFPDDIDYDWYERRATEMLYDMAYLQRPKQMSFF